MPRLCLFTRARADLLTLRFLLVRSAAQIKTRTPARKPGRIFERACWIFFLATSAPGNFSLLRARPQEARQNFLRCKQRRAKRRQVKRSAKRKSSNDVVILLGSARVGVESHQKPGKIFFAASPREARQSFRTHPPCTGMPAPQRKCSYRPRRFWTSQ